MKTTWTPMLLLFFLILIHIHSMWGHLLHAQENPKENPHDNPKKSEIHRFSADEKDVKQLYDALAKGARPQLPSSDQAPPPGRDIPRLKDRSQQFSDRGQWEAEMFKQIEEMRRQMQQFFEDDDLGHQFFGPGGPQIGPKGFGLRQFDAAADPITTREEKNGTIYSVDLSKVDPNSLKIDIKERQVIIKGESREERKESGPYGDSSSISISSFNRAFALPPGVKESAVKIEQKDKVIEITIPKG